MDKKRAMLEIKRSIISAKFDLSNTEDDKKEKKRDKKKKHYHYIMGLADGLSISGFLSIEDLTNIEKDIKKELKIKRGEV